jgi:NADH-quinone oxidoreductase subunit N
MSELSNLGKELVLLSPEICLVIGSVALILLEIIIKHPPQKAKNLLYGCTLLVFLFFCFDGLQTFKSGEYIFSTLFYTGRAALGIKILAGIYALFLVFFHQDHRKVTGIYYACILVMLLGCSLLTYSCNLLSIFLSIELMSVSGYLIIALTHQNFAYEGAIKYLIFGGLSTGVMLFGMSYIYGMSGQLTVDELMLGAINGAPEPLAMFAFTLLFGGFFFKMGVFPFHSWIPDVYQGGSGATAALLAVIPKAPAFLLIFQFFGLFERSAFGLTSVLSDLLIAASIITMILGTFAALRQSNFRRLMAYSSIAHSGFILLISTQVRTTGFTAFFFYLIIYALMSYATFWMIHIVENRFEIHDIKAYAKLNSSISNIPLIALTIILLSFVGIPPTSGFTAKLLLFSSVWEGYQLNGQVLLLTAFVIGLLLTFVSIFYYLLIPYFVFIKAAKTEQIKWSWKDGWIATLTALVLIIIFFAPGLLLDIINGVNFEF